MISAPIKEPLWSRIPLEGERLSNRQHEAPIPTPCENRELPVLQVVYSEKLLFVRAAVE